MRLFARPSLLALIGSLALAAPLAGCGSSDPDYYTLKPWPGVAQAGGPLTLKLRTPGVPSYLDRDAIVRNARGYKLQLASDAAWGEPLADMIGQTLAQDLQQRLPGTNVFTQAGAISTDAQAVLELDVSQFAEDHAGNAEITATLSVTRPDATGPAAARTLHLTMAPNGSGVADLAEALSRLLGQVADEAATEARALGPAPMSPEPLKS